MNRFANLNRVMLVVAAALSLVAAGPRQAEAQILDQYTEGFPIHLRIVTIPAGQKARFQTDSTLVSPTGGFADTVLHLYSFSLGYLGGGDGWSTTGDCAGLGSGLGPSCFEYTNTTSSDIVAYLIIRSWEDFSPAETRVFAFGPGQVNGVLPDIFNGGSTAPFIAGGGSFSHTLSTTAHQYLSTVHSPGDADAHWILVRHSDNNFNAAELYGIATSVGGRINGLAEIDVVGVGGFPSANIGITYGGILAANTGPARFAENNWFFSDYDGDGLSQALERDLGTCDNVQPGDVMPNGVLCSNLDSCALDPAGVACEAELRDTDIDGIRDDVEFYGYDHPQAHLARFGANPAHKDVFIEMNTTDRDGTAPGCQGFALSGSTTNDPRFLGGEQLSSSTTFFENFQAVYDQFPAAYNPDGQPGVIAHFDVGVPNPDPTDPAWGDWGGGGDCYDDPTGLNYTANCGTDQDPGRDWIFVWAFDMAGGGQFNGDWCYRGSSTAVHAHEVGHVFGLGHGGPNGTSGNSINGGNRRPLFPSRMNYRYQNVQAFSTFAMSEGALSVAVNARNADETNPVPGVNLSPLMQGAPPVAVSGADVDWDLDTLIDSGPTIWGHYRDLENGRNARAWKNSRTDAELDTSRYGRHMDAAVTGDFMVFAYVEYDHPTNPDLGTIYLKAQKDSACDMNPNQETDGTWNLGDCLGLGTRFDTNIQADAVAIAPTQLPIPGGGFADGLVMVYRQGTKVYWKYVDVANSSTSTVAGYYFSGGGQAFGVKPASDDPNPSDGILQGAEIALVEVPSTTGPHGGVMMVYTDLATGEVHQAHLPIGATAWNGPVQVAVGSTSIGSFGTVGLTVYAGQVVAGLRPFTTQGLTLYTLPAGATEYTAWTQSDIVPETAGSLFPPPPTAGDVWDVELASAAAPHNVDDELFVFWRRANNDIMQARFDGTSWDLVGTPPIQTVVTQMARVQHERGFVAPAAVYDSRTTVMDHKTTPPTPIDVSLTQGLRVFRDTHRTCQGEDAPGVGTDLGCTLEGYWPGRPADLDCEVNQTEFAYCISDDITPGTGNPAKPSYIQYMPFAEGHNPTNFCDYADWQQVAFGVCNVVANRSAPGGTSYYNPTPLGQGPYCGFAPSFAEPDASGLCVSLLSAPGPNDRTDRTDRPALYAPPAAYTCDF